MLPVCENQPLYHYLQYIYIILVIVGIFRRRLNFV